ncbi:hypothetical protein PTSG_08710 [Salpingoeca rosetta]|uniref:Uncharacterized protein n=1 Tax=Salpingoeca rosetta (strain ATCC 50818 / BSB-021) TaxID=946362 RepID=F2UKG6_SALR5|nr:uncharacterized protein PTSG_08710 [Salpingoeca rosetta]EGD77615.1 hypothetical protein PTSG_08710 [Salpingoeca rosetta]|eukprot:XP_004990503.1 hypothetical protein PTSG_08710 [Salpingoeca rosetta]
MALAPDFKMEKEAAKQLKEKKELLEKGHTGFFGSPNKLATKTLSETMYDRQMHVPEQDKSSKLHRDDRQSRVGLDIHKEERERAFPVRSSSLYGARAPIDNLVHMANGRKKVVSQEFYSKEIAKLG